MNAKKRVKAICFTIILGIVIFVLGYSNTKNIMIPVKYQVYLDGKSIGLVNNRDELYNLINEEQSNIKDEYNVDQVYPPKGFEIEKYLSYDNNTSTTSDIYDQIKNSKSFTIKGYTATVSSKPTETEDAKVQFRVNVLDKKVFEEAINNLVKSFVNADQYNAYINGEVIEIKDTGERIENIYFDENITIKETYLSTEDKIFTNADDLTRYLMFNDKPAEDYVVQKGDTIKNIAEENKLNTNEFLVANPKFSSKDNILAVGEVVNVARIEPKLTLVNEKYVIEDTEVRYDTEVKYDNSQPPSYRVTKTKGENGIQRVAKWVTYKNGAVEDEAQIDQANTYMIKEIVNEVIIKGNKYYNYSNISGSYYETGLSWAWPTNYPYVLSSPFGWRWGTLHDGQDISGTGYGSPIYATAAGEVIHSGWNGMMGNNAGINIVIKHPNGYYSVYAHLSDTYVKEGDIVSRKQVIGAMGQTGWATGTHLHFAIFIGVPYHGGQPINPMILFSK